MSGQLNYRLKTANDSYVCDVCKNASQWVTKAAQDPVKGCTAEGGCRCWSTRTERPVGKIEPIPVTSGKHRRARG